MAEVSRTTLHTAVMLMETLPSLMVGWVDRVDGLMFLWGKFPQFGQVFVFCST